MNGKLENLSGQDKRAVERTGCLISLLIFAGLVSLGVLAYQVVTVPKFRLSVAGIWGGATVFLVGKGILAISKRAKHLISESQERGPDDAPFRDSN